MVIIKKKKTSVCEDVEKLEPCTLLFPVASMEKGTVVPQKIKIRITVQSGNSTS